MLEQMVEIIHRNLKEPIDYVLVSRNLYARIVGTSVSNQVYPFWLRIKFNQFFIFGLPVIEARHFEPNHFELVKSIRCN